MVTLPVPGYRAVDGTSAMLHDEGYVFLFNPNMPAYTVNLTVDESMDISNASRLCVCVCVCVSVCVLERERERERESVYMSACGAE